jgi:RNA polymerase sigma-70 factor (ECF subfamily)
LSESLELVERAKAGDPRAFQELVRPHVDSIRRFARSFCKNDGDADDLAQDALLKAYRAIGSYDGRASLTTWLYTVAKNQFLDHRRGKLFRWRSRESELTEANPTSIPNAEQLLDAHRKVEMLWRALGRVDEKFRIPLVLVEIDGLTYEQVAEIERLPVGTVRSRISRAKAQLREHLGFREGLPTIESSGTTSRQTSSDTVTRGAR